MMRAFREVSFGKLQQTCLECGCDLTDEAHLPYDQYDQSSPWCPEHRDARKRKLTLEQRVERLEKLHGLTALPSGDE